MRIKLRVVFFIIGIVFCFGSVRAQDLDIPQHPNAKLVKEIKGEMVDFRTTTYSYTSSLSQNNLVQFYRKELTQQGWQEEEFEGEAETGEHPGSGYAFKKEDDLLALAFKPADEKGVTYYKLAVQYSEEAPSIPSNPEAELIDKDVEKKSLDGDIIYYYESPLGEERIVQFYRERLSYQGWQEDSYEVEGIYSFKKDNKLLILNFSPSTEEGLINYGVSLSTIPESGEGSSECTYCQ